MTSEHHKRCAVTQGAVCTCGAELAAERAAHAQTREAMERAVSTGEMAADRCDALRERAERAEKTVMTLWEARLQMKSELAALRAALSQAEEALGKLTKCDTERYGERCPQSWAHAMGGKLPPEEQHMRWCRGCLVAEALATIRQALGVT